MSTDISRARELARQAHDGQVDSQGRDYVVAHLSPIAGALERALMWTVPPSGVDRDIAVQVAWLHDVLEDTDMTADGLRERGFDERVVHGVESVTRRPGEGYPDLIGRAIEEPHGAVVKLADNTWNIVCNPGLAVTEPQRAVSMLRGRYLPARARLVEVTGLGLLRALAGDMQQSLLVLNLEAGGRGRRPARGPAA